MKQLSKYIHEKLTLNKDSFKDIKCKFFPKTKKQLIEYISQLIEDCEGNHLDLNCIDVSELKSLCYVFTNTTGKFSNKWKDITSLDVSDWDVSNVEDMEGLFSFCYATTFGDLSKWDVSKVENMSEMFYWCRHLKEIDISNWNTEKLTNASRMFEFCTDITSIGDLSDWNIDKLYNANEMFSECWDLKTLGNLNKWDMNGCSIDNIFKNTKLKNKPDWAKRKRK